MKRAFLFTLSYLIAHLGCSLSAAEFKIDGYTFTLPDGFTLEKVAGPPSVDRPISADFDEQGRLYVTTEDIESVAAPVLRHRIIPNFNAEAEGISTEQIIQKVLSLIPRSKGERLL